MGNALHLKKCSIQYGPIIILIYSQPLVIKKSLLALLTMMVKILSIPHSCNVKSNILPIVISPS